MVISTEAGGKMWSSEEPFPPQLLYISLFQCLLVPEPCASGPTPRERKDLKVLLLLCFLILRGELSFQMLLALSYLTLAKSLFSSFGSGNVSGSALSSVCGL